MTDLFAGTMLAPDAPKGLGANMAGAGKSKRRALDYYPTPPEATRALLAAERPWLDRYRPGRIWEPCARGGAIVGELHRAGFHVVAGDIVPDPAHGVAEQDLFAVRVAWAPALVSNFPFALARPMLAHCWRELRVDYMALLFKATFFNCGKGADLWRAGLGFSRRWDVTWRLDFTGQDAPVMDCSWLVWDRRDPAQRFGLLDREGPVAVDAPGLI